LSPILAKGFKKFFNSIHSYFHTGELGESCLILQRQLFENLKDLRLFIPDENQDELKNSENLKFPSGIDSFWIVSGKGVLVPRNLPGSLRSLSLYRWITCGEIQGYSDTEMQEYSDYPTGIELMDCMSLISSSCHFLEELTIYTRINGSCGFPLANTARDGNPNYYAFKSKLKIFKIFKTNRV